MIRRTFRRPPARRGAILLVVLGMLALFAVVGLSFVLYAESEATGARNNRAARNELADPDPVAVANQFLAQLIFDTDANSSLWGHGLARSRFGQAGNQSPYTGTGFPFGISVTLNGATMDQTQVVNYSAANAFGGTSPDTWNKAVPWTYPDRNNFHLAYYDPATDQVTVPSFYRPDLFGTLAPTNPNWTNADGRFKILRPRPAEHPAFPTVPMNADGNYTGDVSNLKFLTGNQKNDSLWMDLGLPIKEWRGRRYKAMVAPLVLDLGGKIDLRVAGNNRSGGASGSHGGWGPWEMNPTGLLTGGAVDMATLVNLRQTGANPGAATAMDRFRGLSTGTLNRGLIPTQYSLIDADGWGTGAPDAMALPAAGGFSPFPTYTPRFAGTQALLTAELAATHGQSISPSQWGRRQTPTTGTPWMPSLEDQLRLDLRSGGPKGASGYAGQFNPNQRLTTLFSASQRWGEITVPTATGTAKLAAIDITRPLPDYRTNPAVPLSPANFGNFVAARIARQNLARDIFVRLLAVSQWPLAGFTNPGGPVIDGQPAGVAYNPLTGYVQIGYAANAPEIAFLRQWAQYAANMVDQIDSDDVSTTFVWNPVDPFQPDVNDTTVPANLPNFAAATIGQRTVFGTELPKLVLNETYCMLNNSRQDSDVDGNTGPPLGIPPTNKPVRDNFLKKYWIELHNPLSADPVLPDGGAARLRYDPTAGNTVPDQNNNPVAAPFASSVYQIEIAEVPAGAPGVPAQPYSTFLAGNPLGSVADTTAVPGMVTKLRLTDYTAYNTVSAAPPDMPAPLPVNDALNVVLPASNTAGPQGYFLIGPRDWFITNPVHGVTNNLNVVDHTAAQQTVPANPALKNALIYDTGTKTAAGITTEVAKTNVILLRRLVNPYLPAQPDPTVLTSPYNPYMTVDFLENIPTRDRVKFDGTIAGKAVSNAATVGRKHPYAAAPTYGAVNAAVVDQTAAAGVTPPHTFLTKNSNLDNAAGLAWLAHLDREPVNQLELLMTSAVSPTQLTQNFYDGAIYQKHLKPPQAPAIPVGTPATPPLLDQINFPTAFRAYDLLSVGSRLPGVPLGGREPGRVNINTAGDAAVLNAVLDPQSGNTFTANSQFNPALGGVPLPYVFPSLLASRTPGAGNVPSATTAEGGNDRPFQPQFGFQETLFRQGAIANYPALFNNLAGNHQYLQSEPLRKGWNNLTTVSDGFLVAFTVGFFEVVNPPGFPNTLGKEIYDKVPGDLRAQYAGVVDRTALTIDPPPASAPTQLTFGAKPWETKLTADAAVGSTTITIQAQCTAAGSCTVFDDGTPVPITAIGGAAADTGPLLRVGYAGIAVGGDGEWVRVDAITPGPAGSGTAILTINTTASTNPALPAYSVALNRFHGGNSRVSNAQVGHPGPQPAFDYREPTGKYRGVLPFFMRMVP